MRIPPRPNLPSRAKATTRKPPPKPEPVIELPDIPPMRTDVCFYSATPAALIAASYLARLGLSVLIVEPTHHLGGLLAGGICHTPIDTHATRGLSLEFFTSIGRIYNTGPASRWEPCVASAVFNDLARDQNLTILFSHRLASVNLIDRRVTQIRLDHVGFDDEIDEDDQTMIEAKVFIDCSYTGDLLAMAGATFNETPASLLFHLCLTNNPASGRAIPAPDELIDLAPLDLYQLPFQVTRIENAKAQVTLLPEVHSILAGDLPDYVSADHATRQHVWKTMLQRTQALVYQLAHDESVPDPIRAQVSRWALCSDEFHASEGWPPIAEILGGRKLIAPDLYKDVSVAIDPITEAGVPMTAVLCNPSICANLLSPVCAAYESNNEVTRMALAEGCAMLARLMCDLDRPFDQLPADDLRQAFESVS